MNKVPVRLTSEEAKQKIAAMGGTIMFEKVLTSSDVNGTGRLVIPKSQAEAHFPHLEQQTGMNLVLTDTEGKKHTFRFRFWVNNQSRMYLLEQTAPVQAKYRMQAGDVLVFAKLPEGQYAICGRKGTKDDVSRKPPVRRTASQQPAASGGSGGADASPATGEGKANPKRVRSRGGDTLKNKRMKQKAATQEIQSLLSYWSGYSLPMRRDGVFRAVPNTAVMQEGDRVLAQYGAWSAIVSVGGELFQAFFDTHEAANAALEAALQSKGEEAAGAGNAPGKRKAAAAAGAPEPKAAAAEEAAAGASPPADADSQCAASQAAATATADGRGQVDKLPKHEPEEAALPSLPAVAVEPAAG